MSFSYNSDYTLAYKIDAKNQKIAYDYDEYRRVANVKRYPVSSGAESLCDRVSYSYNGPNVGAMAWGNYQTGNYSACVATHGGGWNESYSYNAAGQMTQKDFLKTASSGSLKRVTETTGPKIS